jgi:hypothetical protein
MALSTKIHALTLALTAGIVTAPAAFADAPPAGALHLAQNNQQPAQSDQGQSDDGQDAAAEAFDPTDEQVDSFVSATVRIITIQREAQQEMAAAEEQEKQQQVRDEALQMIVAAVEEEGLSVDEYNGIVQKVESDPEFGQTVQQRIQEQVAE